MFYFDLSPVSIQTHATQALALRALHKRKTQATQALAQATQALALETMIGCLPTQALAFLAVFVYATHTTKEIAFEWKRGLRIRLIIKKLVYLLRTFTFRPTIR